MKKLLIIMALCFAGIASHAQSIKPMVNPNGFALDTASQAAAEGPIVSVNGSAKVLSIVLVTTKISGTVAGTIAWQGSNDGTNYVTIGSATTLVDAAGVTSYTYKEVDKGYAYYKALITQTGTSSLSYSGTTYTQSL
jgi:hypothetical protein